MAETKAPLSNLVIEVDANVKDAEKQLRFIRMFEGDQPLPLFAAAIEKSSIYLQGVWVKNASGNTVSFDGNSFKVNRITGQYVRSIQQGLIYPLEGAEYTRRARMPRGLNLEEKRGLDRKFGRRC
jgi:hypothetical protein